MGSVIPLYTSVGSYHTYGEPLRSQSASDEYLVPVRLPTGVYRPSYHLFKTLDLPSGEGVLTH